MQQSSSGRPPIVPAITLPPRVLHAEEQISPAPGTLSGDDALSVSSDSTASGDNDAAEAARQSPQALDAITWRQRLAALRPLLAGEVNPSTFLLQSATSPRAASSVPVSTAAGSATPRSVGGMQGSITPQSTPRGMHDSVDSGPESAEELNTRLDEANARIANMLMQTRAAASEVLSL